MNSVTLRVPVTFPPNPAVGDEFTASNGATYVWDGFVWMAVGGGNAPGAALNFRRGLTRIGDDVDLDPATQVEIGGLLEAPLDGRAYTRLAATWSVLLPTGFAASAPYIALGTEATGAVLATLTIPPADLPAEPFYWVDLGQGDGAVFLHNANATGTVGGNPQAQINDDGSWTTVGTWTLTGASFPPGAPTLIRALVVAAGSNVLRHYNPAIHLNGIQARVIAGTTPPNQPSTLSFGIEGRIIQYGQLATRT